MNVSYTARQNAQRNFRFALFGANFTKRGTIAGLAEGILLTEASSFKHFAGRIGFWTVPMVVSCGSFVITNHALAKITGKDTWYNHMVGGVAAASVWGAMFNSYKVGFPLALGFAAWFGLKKWSVDNGVNLLGSQPKFAEFMYLAQKFDLSIMKAP
ncbi:uncharacterized protein LOC119434145 isoform X2 [Dermacentor silvarum]|uniref:uncharacterized protein LOC119434145 isoform X2 n=1 Tax=Dermacentor silvarum TaxID=543639 RepID=UPI002100A26C|nr:uncharacterized protein LOC119434145 isoform X2 [Dermacentor silvarum]